MIVDAHYHLDPRLESLESLLAQMQAHLSLARTRSARWT